MPSVSADGRFVVKATWGQLKSGAARASADLDLQAIAFLDDGSVVDAVYWDRPRSTDSAIVHTSGDEGGHAGGRAPAVHAEEMVVDLNRVAPNVAAIAFTLSSFDTSVALDAVTDVSVNMEHQASTGGDAASADAYYRSAFPEFGAGVVVGCVGALLRMGKRTFDVAETEKGLAAAANFVDAIPMVRQELRLPPPPKGAAEFKLPLRLTKGESAEVAVTTRDNASGTVVAGCSWDLENRGLEDVDIDLCAVLLSKTGTILHRVHWGQLEACNAVWHTGDKTSGEGELGEDKEQVRVDLGRLPPEVESVCFIVNSYDSPSGALGSVGDIYFRLADAQSQCEILRVDGVGAGRQHNGLALAVLCRGATGNAWRLHATSAPVDGESLLAPAVSAQISAVVIGCASENSARPPRNVRAAFAATPHRQALPRHHSSAPSCAATPPTKSQPPAATKQREEHQPSVPATAAFVVFAAVALYLLFGSA